MSAMAHMCYLECWHSIVSHCQKATDNITHSDENVNKLATAGGIETIVKTINVHIKNTDVCKYGCWALVKITESNSKA